MATETGSITVARDLSANWITQNPTLGNGEMGYETDTGAFKLGDGTTAWNTLTYANVPSIISFPDSPSTGQRVWHSLRDLEYFYDGTRWLTTTQFGLSFIHPLKSTAFDDSRIISELAVPYYGVYDIYMETFEAMTYQSSGTWTVNLKWIAANTASTTIAGLSGFNVANLYRTKTSTINSILSASAVSFRVEHIEVVGGSNIFNSGFLRYRLVG